MCTPIGPTGNNPTSSSSEAASEIKRIITPPPQFIGESTIEEMNEVPAQSHLQRTSTQREIDEVCSRLFVALSEVKTKLEQITDPTLPSSKGDLQAAIDELTEIATTVHDLDRWKASLANLVKKTIVILPNINTELEGILANLTPAKPQEGNNLHLLFKKLQRHFSGNENS